MAEDSSPNRAIVFVDGNNLYHRLREKGWKTWIDIGALAKRLVGERNLVHIYYYNAPPPGGKVHTKRGNEYLSQVQRVPNLTFRRAWLQATQKSDEYGPHQSYIEKGADTALSTDLVSLAARDKFDVAVIVSSDGDYAPAARAVRQDYGKRVEVVYFEGCRPFAMESCSLMRAFRRGMLMEYNNKRAPRGPRSKPHRS